MRPSGIITITTDFGLADSYVGTMKGVMLGIAPGARLVDITHTVGPQEIHQAAYIVQTFYPYFPPGTVHLVVVDPGVGSDRRQIALVTPEAMFVAPDNGVLTYAWRDALARWGREQVAVYELAERRFWLPRISNTFHGRDIFSPVAAHLANGVPPSAMGPWLPGITEAALEQPAPGRSGELVGRIIHVDHFGNCITNIMPEHLVHAGMEGRITVQIIDQRIPGLYRTYAEGASGSLIALVGSSNRLELAVCNGNAARTLGVGIGDTVKIFPREEPLV
ncbi:MAG TPA: SAM-dependent chlorinase/fluorinase [Roseiflexaceae bacterium]|nr:SAM-dependent chlorinase/fluorinase [Roseiflexaceae bacterium]